MNVRLQIRLVVVRTVPVLVALAHKREVVVDDHVDLEDVDAARDDVRGDEDLIEGGLASGRERLTVNRSNRHTEPTHLLMSLAEPVDDLISLRAVLRTVQRRHLVSLLDHPLRDVVCLLPIL